MAISGNRGVNRWQSVAISASSQKLRSDPTPCRVVVFGLSLSSLRCSFTWPSRTPLAPSRAWPSVPRWRAPNLAARRTPWQAQTRGRAGSQQMLGLSTTTSSSCFTTYNTQHTRAHNGALQPGGPEQTRPAARQHAHQHRHIIQHTTALHTSQQLHCTHHTTLAAARHGRRSRGRRSHGRRSRRRAAAEAATATTAAAARQVAAYRNYCRCRSQGRRRRRRGRGRRRGRCRRRGSYRRCSLPPLPPSPHRRSMPARVCMCMSECMKHVHDAHGISKA